MSARLLLLEMICPHCGLALRALHHGPPPSAGDVEICPECAQVALFDAALVLRSPTLAELQEIADSAETGKLISKIQDSVRQARIMNN